MMDAGTIRALNPGLVPMTPALAAALARATETASAAGVGEITLEHLLYALIGDADALAVLDSSRVDIDRLRDDIAIYLAGAPRSVGAAMGDLAVSADATRILEAASAAARGGRRRDINGAIVLAAIVGDGQTVAAQLLQNQGLTFDEAIRALQRSAASVIREAPAPLPPADDVLARARERVQSRFQPSFRDMMGAPPRAAPAPFAPPPPIETPPPPAEAAPPVEDAVEPQPTLEAQPLESPVETASDDVETAAPATADGLDEAAPLRPPLAGRDSEADEAAVCTALGDGPPQQWDFEQQDDGEAPAPSPSPAFDIAPRVQSPAGWTETQQQPDPPSTAQFGAAPGPFDRPPSAPPEAPLGNITFSIPRPAPIQPPPIPQRPYARPGFGPPSGFAPPPPGPQTRWPEFDPFPPQGGARFPAPFSEPSFGEPLPPGPPQAASGRGFGPELGFPAPPRPMAPAPTLGADAKRERLPRGEIGQLAENIPRSMRVGVTERVEIRIAKASVAALIDGLDGGHMAWRHDVVVTKAMSVRMRAPDGGFFIETASPETQWIENQLGFASDDFASWRFLVTPQERGRTHLQIIVSARTIGSDGVAAETALPDQVVDVKVRSNYRRSFARLGGWAVAAIVGGVLAKFGEGGLEFANAIIARIQQ